MDRLWVYNIVPHICATHRGLWQGTTESTNYTTRWVYTLAAEDTFSLTLSLTRFNIFPQFKRIGNDFAG